MARPKSFIRTVAVDEAARAHDCQQSDAHRIHKGDKRLGCKKGRSPEYFCRECAIKFIERDIAKLQGLVQELEGDPIQATGEAPPPPVLPIAGD